MKVSICASDFSSQSKNWGESFEGPSLPIAVMLFDGREKKIQHVSESRLGLQMLTALGVCLSLHPCSKVFPKHLRSAFKLNGKTRGSVGVLIFPLDDN